MPRGFLFADIDGGRVIPQAVTIEVRIEGERLAGNEDAARAGLGRSEDPVEVIQRYRRQRARARIHALRAKEASNVWNSRHSARVILVTLILLCSAPMRLTAASGPPADSAREVYVVPFSHLDYFWAGTREECLSRGNRVIAKAIRIARQHQEFRFLIEDEDFTANFLDSHRGSDEVRDLLALVKAGRIEIAPKWAAIFQNLPGGEVLARNLVYGKRYAREAFGVNPQVAHMGDIPGFTPQFPQMLAKADIPFMVMTRMGPSDASLFHWRSPDGSKVLVWNDLKGYHWGSALGLHDDLTEERKARVLREVQEVQATTPGPIFMTWGIDLWAPTEKLVDNVAALDRDRTGGPRFALATPTEFFRRAAGAQPIPEKSGEIPSSWPNVATSLLHMWQLAVPATNTLTAAESFATVSHALGLGPYPAPELRFLWQKLIESMDHNHDGQGGAIGDERKMGYSQLVLLHGGEILRDSLRNIAERVEAPFPSGFPIVVFNPLAWPRDDVVRAHVTLYGDVVPRDIKDFTDGIRLVDEKGGAVPFEVEEQSENISRALQIVFAARDVPSLGYRTYSLVPGPAPVFPPTSRLALDRDHDRRDPRRPLGSDVIENDFYRVTVDKATGRIAVFDRNLGREICRDLEVVAVEERGGNNVAAEELTGRTIVNSVHGVEIEENGGVRTVARITGLVADVPIVQRLTLYRELKRLDLENTVDWQGPRYVRFQQLFPLPTAARVRYGVAFGSNDAGDLMPGAEPHNRDELQRGAWEKYRQIQDWVFAGTPEWGITLAADHQVVRLDEGILRAEMIRGLRFTSVKVVRGSEVTSLSYPPPGRYVFHYSLSSASGDWKTSRAYRQGAGFNQPLVPVSVADEVSRKTLPPAQSFASVSGGNLVVSAVKQSDDGRSVVVRFYEAEGAPSETKIVWLGEERPLREVNLLEEDSGLPSRRAVRVAPYEIKTIRIQRLREGPSDR